MRNRRNKLTRAYEALRQELQAILYEEDPEGMGSSVGAPPDEYAEEAAALIPMLQGSASEGEIAAVLHKKFGSAQRALVERVHRAWSQFLEQTR